MKSLVIARANVIRMFRDRQGLVFMFALPLVIIVVYGLAFGGAQPMRVGVAGGDGGPLAGRLAGSLDEAAATIRVDAYASPSDLRAAVERGKADLGLVIPAGYDAALGSGRPAQLEIVAQPVARAQVLRPIVDAAIHRQAALVTAARYASDQRGISFEQALADAQRLEPSIGGVDVVAETSGEPLIAAGMNGYVMGAQSQLVLFMFLTSMTAATQLIVTRQLGVSRRMFAGPTHGRTIIAGEMLGRFAVAMIQGLFIVAVTAFVFGVSWGDPIASAALIISFALVGTGAAMLIGSIATNAEQASAIGVGLAMLLGALGGAMVPPEVFPEAMRTISRLTPQAWAIDGLRATGVYDGGLVDVLPQVAVLLAYAGVLLVLATLRFRRAVLA